MGNDSKKGGWKHSALQDYGTLVSREERSFAGGKRDSIIRKVDKVVDNEGHTTTVPFI